MKRNTIRAMQPDRFLTLIEKLNLSQRAAARFFGVNDRTVRHYADGSSPVDPRTAMLLEIMVRHKIEPDTALKLIGINVREAIAAAKPLAAPRYYDHLRI